MAGEARFGKVRQGKAWTGEARRVKVRQARRGTVVSGMVRSGLAGMEPKERSETMKTTSAYKWKTYAYKTSADVAGAVCEELDRTVGLTPANLVDASRAEDAPLHDEFEWDDEIAGEAYRKEQARMMITNLAIVIEEHKQEPVRAYYSFEYGFRKNTSTYVSTIKILSDSDKRTQLLERAKSEMIAFKSKYSMLTELADVFESIDSTVKQISMFENEEEKTA